jgi:RNA recognition motif-containing protein
MLLHAALPHPGDEMEYKLYVGNLPYTTTEDDLKPLFEQAGAVKSVALIKDRETGRSKGFAFVEMETQEGMDKAISMLNGKDMQGRALSVSIARPREERSGGGGGFRGGGNRGGGGFRGGGGGGGNDRRKPRDNRGGY